MQLKESRKQILLELCKSYKKQLLMGIIGGAWFFCSFIIPVYAQTYPITINNRDNLKCVKEGSKFWVKNPCDVDFSELKGYEGKVLVGDGYTIYFNDNDNSPITAIEKQRYPWMK